MKLSTITLQIGFTSDLLDLQKVEEYYSELTMNTSHFFEAMIDNNKMFKDILWGKIGKHLNETDWIENVIGQLENGAYYLIGLFENSIHVTGPFLYSLPLFNARNPSYVNYGHLGGVIAHELTHALDMQSDGYGEDYSLNDTEVVLNRWTEESKQDYEEMKQCIIDQYSSFNDTKNTKLKLNGTETQTEDIADNGGLKLALHAYRKLTKQMITPEPRLPLLEHLSPEQMFMISVANTHCQIPNKENILKQFAIDSHSLAEFRVKGMMMNSPDFSELFSCRLGDPMNPKHKCNVW